MRNVLDRSCTENQNTHFMFSNFFFNRPVCEKIWKNIVEPGRPQMTIWRMRFACWIPEATNTHSEYVTLIAVFRLQWLYDRASMLRYTYTARLLYDTLTAYCSSFFFTMAEQPPIGPGPRHCRGFDTQTHHTR